MNFNEYLSKNLKNPEFCKEYFALEAEYLQQKLEITKNINEAKNYAFA